MRTSKFLMLALLLAGVAVSFSSCQKDDATKSAPTIKLYEADGRTPIEGEVTPGKIVVSVTPAEGVKIQTFQYKVSYEQSGNVKGDKDFKKLTTNRKGPSANELLYDLEVELPNEPVTNAKLEIEVYDNNSQKSSLNRGIKANGSTPAPAGTALKESKDGAIDHAMGTGKGGFSFVKGPVAFDAADADIVNTSAADQEFVKGFKAANGAKLIKLATKLDYDKTTAEGLAEAIKSLKPEAGAVTFAGGEQVVVVKGDTNYLVEIVTVSATGNADGSAVSTKNAKHQGFIKFKYRASK